MKNKAGTFLKVFFLILLLLLSFALSLLLGAEKPSWFLIQYLRLPRSILVLLSGALLAASGAVFQMFFRNPLAEPGLLGISAGATLGAVTAACLGGLSFFGGFVSSINIFAFAGAFISGLVLALISSSRKISSVVLLLCGTALGALYSSVSSTIMLMHNRELFGIFSWLLGSFNGRGLNELKFVIIPAVLAFVFISLILNPLDVMNGGEDSAKSLGVNVTALRLMVILSGSLAVSVAVCAGGTISFVGLVAPHIMRKLFSSKSKVLVWTSAIGGAILLLAADTVARVVMKPGELPCGIITSFIGVPFFVALIFKKKTSAKVIEKMTLQSDEKILAQKTPDINQPQSLVLENYSFAYSKEKKVLSNISFSLGTGDFVCLCGPNGAGKSTLLQALFDSCGIENYKEKAAFISFLHQNESALWDYTVFDTVLSGRFCHTGQLGIYSPEDYEIARDAIRLLGLDKISEKSVHEISGGEFQKVRLARSFAQGARFLLLDEPLSSLDFVASENLMKTLKEKCGEQNKGVVVSIHDINTASRFAEKVVLLGKNISSSEEQKFFQGTSDEVFTEGNLSAVYNSPVKVWRHPEFGVPQV